MNDKTSFDIIICGAGLSGLMLAHALGNLNLSIALIDAKAFVHQNQTINEASQQHRDLRTLALSKISERILKNLSLKAALDECAFAIKNIHISNRGHFGFSRINANALGFNEVGWVIGFDKLTHILSKQLTTQKNLTIFDKTNIFATQLSDNERTLSIQREQKAMTLTAKLVIACDGTHSFMREQLSIPVRQVDYQQSAIVANVGVGNQNAEATAYERFTESGPLALLPINDKTFSLVWSLQPEVAKIISNADDKTFLESLQNAFGYRVGEFSWVGKRQSFELTLVKSETLIADRAILLGNAAHTLHPIAGQGFNLTLRDIADLQQMLSDCIEEKQDPGVVSKLNTYAARRKKDVDHMINFTHQLVKIFSNEYWPHTLIRNLALTLADLSPLKRQIAFRAMGFIKHMPALALEK